MCTKTDVEMILRDFAAGVQSIFGDKLKEVILFGSYARGDYDNESDIDIALLVDITREDERHYTDDVVSLVSEVDKKYGYIVVLAPIVLSYVFFTEWQEAIPFYRAIRDEGVSLSA